MAMQRAQLVPSANHPLLPSKSERKTVMVMKTSQLVPSANHLLLPSKSERKMVMATTELLPSPNHRLLPSKSGDKYLLHKQIEKTTSGFESDFDLRTLMFGNGWWDLFQKWAKRWKGQYSRSWRTRNWVPLFDVFLHHDYHNKREYVVDVLLLVIRGMDVLDAVNIVRVAEINGQSLVVVCGKKQDADEYSRKLMLFGVPCTVERL